METAAVVATDAAAGQRLREAVLRRRATPELDGARPTEMPQVGTKSLGKGERELIEPLHVLKLLELEPLISGG